ncbi:cupin domain-containing protein [Chloroflexi bacterium TSY]|nr:cupin domain-containing protein [Chloroflexi bacterium TSY]
MVTTQEASGHDYGLEDLLKLPGEGEKTHSDMVIKASTEMMAGDFSVMEGVIYPQELLAPHTHEHEAQLVYVISGELEFEVGGKDGLRFTAPAGSYVIKPRGIMHGFWNKTDEPARYIELSGKSYFEGFVKSKEKGDLYAVNHAKDFGMTTHMTDSVRLFTGNKLTGLSMMEFPKLPKLPELPEWFRKIIPSN